MSHVRKRYYLKTPGKIIVAGAIVLIIYLIFHREITGLGRLLFGGKTYTNVDFDIPDYISSRDTDGDGIDDQSDILAGAREYVSKRPVYESKYYSGGWPDDNRGVCTDVVANALRAAGYDLKELVSEDIAAAPGEYDDDCGDDNIDFRRVRNLLTYFKRHALSLTTDFSEIAEWQGGDIVVFKGHIGVVSDKRNRHGVPLLIHHGGSNGEGSRSRPDYEEDVLDLRNDILGHFRVG